LYHIGFNRKLYLFRVIAISYLCAMPSLTALAKQAEEQGNEMVRKQLHNVNPSALGFVTLLALIAALYIKVFFISDL